MAARNPLSQFMDSMIDGGSAQRNKGASMQGPMTAGPRGGPAAAGMGVMQQGLMQGMDMHRQVAAGLPPSAVFSGPAHHPAMARDRDVRTTSFLTSLPPCALFVHSPEISILMNGLLTGICLHE